MNSMRTKQFLAVMGSMTTLSACSLSPDFKLPEWNLPSVFKQQPETLVAVEMPGDWKIAEPLEQKDRGEWWKIFGDEQLNNLESEAVKANASLQIAAARVEQSRGIAGASVPSLIPDLDIGANAFRAKSASTSGVGFGQPELTQKPYTLFSAEGILSYELDLFGRVRENYKALQADTQAEEAAYKSALLALQADVAAHYFNIKSLDSERQLLRETLNIRTEGTRILQRKFEIGMLGEQDSARSQAELAATKAELIALDRQRAITEHALALLLGKLPSEFSLAESPLTIAPPAIPAGLPSKLLERRPDIVAAQASMAAANARIGVARAAFFPRISLTAFGGYQSTQLSELFKWSHRAWALGQTAGSAITMPIFDNGRNLSRLDTAQANYEAALGNYRQQVLVAFRDVEDMLVTQRLQAQQAQEIEQAATSAGRATYLVNTRFNEGEIDYFEVVTAERDSLSANRAAVQIRGQRLLTTINLIRALGGGWDLEGIPNTSSTPSAPTSSLPSSDVALKQPLAPLTETQDKPIPTENPPQNQ